MTTPTAERDLLERVHEQLEDHRGDSRVERSVVGERLVAVELSDDTCAMGIAHCPSGGIDHRIPTDPLALSRWAFEPPDANPVAAALGIATLNARSTGLIEWREGDPMAALNPDVDRISTVGLFQAAIRKFDGVEVRVIEREPIDEIDPPDGVTVSVYRPDEATSAISCVDVLFVTGSSLIYGGTTDYLRAAIDVPTVVLIGATASFLPASAFAAGVTVFAGTRVTSPDRVLRGVESGLCGTDLHDEGLEKVYVAADDGSAGLDLRG